MGRRTGNASLAAVLVTLGVVFVSDQRCERAHAGERREQFFRLRLRDNIHVNGQPPNGIQAQEQACAALELDR